VNHPSDAIRLQDEDKMNKPPPLGTKQPEALARLRSTKALPVIDENGPNESVTPRPLPAAHCDPDLHHFIENGIDM